MAYRIVNSFLDEDNHEPKKKRLNIRIGNEDVDFFQEIKAKAEKNYGRKLSNTGFMMRILEFYNYVLFENDNNEAEVYEKIARGNYLDKKLNYIDLNTNKNLRLAITILQNIGLQGLDNIDNKSLEEFIEPLDQGTEASEISAYLKEQVEDEIHRRKLRK